MLLSLLLLTAERLLKAETRPLYPGSLERFAGWRPVWAIAILAACLSYAGTYLVYRHFALSFDEFMAECDATIIAHGRLIAPVAAEWRDYVGALQPMLMLQVPGGDFWASSYLPVNAGIRALFMLLGDSALAGPVLSAVALLALYGVARRLWPERPDAALISTLLLACSSQFLMTAMTPYAIAAHLALNLVWLWLFLRDTRTSHALAAGVAFAACGLHQVAFHPLFAAPFLLTVLRSRRWKLAAFYAAAYAAICLFWILYWTLLLKSTGAPSMQSAGAGMANLLRHIDDMVEHNLLTTIPNVGLLVLRFVAWQSPLLIPLALIGFIAFRRQNTMVRDLALGFALTVGVLLILVPFQGHGWGYRYLHGLLGSASLLAAQGWIYLTERTGPTRRQTAALLTSLCVSLFVIFPWYAYQTRTFISPYLSATEAIAHSSAQVVLIDPVDVWYGIDLTRNDPFLRNSPKVMALGHLDEDKVGRLCRDYDVAIFDRRDADLFGLRVDKTAITSPQAFRAYRQLRQILASLNCGRPMTAAPTESPRR